MIGRRDNELTFKINLEHQTGFQFKLEEPDLKHCSIEFSNESEMVRCSMFSSKLDSSSKFGTRPDQARIRLSYEIRPDCICITYWPTLIGFHTLHVTSAYRQIRHRLLIKDPASQSELSTSHSSVAHSSPFIEINLSELPASTGNLSGFETIYSTATSTSHRNEHIDDHNEQSSLSEADELHNLRRSSKVSSELNKITNNYKISSHRTPSTTHSNRSISSLSTTSIHAFHSSLTPENRLSPTETPVLSTTNPSAKDSTNDFINDSTYCFTNDTTNDRTNNSKSKPTLNSTAIDPLQSSADSSGYNGTLFEMNSCISDSFLLTKFSPITQPTTKDLNNNRLLSSLNRRPGKKVLAFGDALVNDENSSTAVNNPEQISDRIDLVNDQPLAKISLKDSAGVQQATRSIDQLVSQPAADQQVYLENLLFNSASSSLSNSTGSVDQPSAVNRFASNPIKGEHEKWPLESDESESTRDQLDSKLIDNGMCA